MLIFMTWKKISLISTKNIFMNMLFNIIFLFTGALLSVLFAAILQRKLESSFIKLFNDKYSSKSIRNISGLWLTQYIYPFNDTNGKLTDKVETQIVKFKQKSNLVYGETIIAEEHPEVFEGKITLDRYFTGQYINTLNHHNYHGSFQFVLSSGHKRMRGKWIGFDDFGEVNCGEWRWLQLYSTNKVDKNMVQKAKKGLKSLDLFNDKQFKTILTGNNSN